MSIDDAITIWRTGVVFVGTVWAVGVLMATMNYAEERDQNSARLWVAILVLGPLAVALWPAVVVVVLVYGISFPIRDALPYRSQE